MVKFKLVAQFPVDYLLTQMCLVICSFCANLLHSLTAFTYYSISECSKLAQKEHITRHIWVGR